MLRLENITWSSPDNRAILRGVDLTVPDSKLVVITGPNGGGKTTLAKIIAGIVKPDTGRILLDDEDITEHDVTRRAREGISYAFQQPVRFKGITVRQLIETAAGETLEYKRLCEILGNVGLCAKNYLDREVNATLSGGEIKRIELATVLARHTRLSVFDEPEGRDRFVELQESDFGIQEYARESLGHAYHNFAPGANTAHRRRDCDDRRRSHHGAGQGRGYARARAVEWRNPDRLLQGGGDFR